MARQLLLVLSMMGAQICFAVDPSCVSLLFSAGRAEILEGEANMELYDLPTGQAQFEALQNLADSLVTYQEQVWRETARKVLRKQKNRAASHLSKFLAAADSPQLNDEDEWLRFSLVLRGVIVTYESYFVPQPIRADPILHDLPPPYSALY